MFSIAVSILLLILFANYYGLIVRFLIGWDKLESLRHSANIPPVTAFSCVVAFRNEQANLTTLIERLKGQQHDRFEVILVDDHSTDSSWKLAEKQIVDLPDFRLIKNKGQGKKAALATGVGISHFDYIVFTDADCIHSSQWLHSLAQAIKKDSPHLLVGPVGLTKPTNFFERFQAVDFLSLVTSGAGAIGANSPIMCNGANLTVLKEVWLQAQSALKTEWASGDDIFLLQYCKAHKKKIAFVKSQEAIVQTYPEQKLSTFLRQRARWASKTKGYSDGLTLQVAWVVLLTNAIILGLPLVVILQLNLGLTLLALYMIKIAIDYLLIKRGATFFNIKIGFAGYLGIALIYPAYIVVSVAWAFLGGVSWKNRKV